MKNAHLEHGTAAVVVGLDSMQGLQAARILHARGIPVHAVAADCRHHACTTNVCSQIVFADTGGDALLPALEAIAAGLRRKPLLVPCQDKSVSVISRHRTRLAENFRFILPDAATVDMLMDKDAFDRFALERGLPIPATRRLENRDDAAAAAREMPFPCLLKPARRGADWDRHTRRKVFVVSDGRSLLQRYDECHRWTDAMIAQQWIAGSDDSLYSCNVYFGRNGDALATFVARKLRQWPIDAGSSCLGEEVRDDVVLETTLSLFRGVGYRGLGYLEMKRDAISGKYYIIEPNVGRPTGRSAIAEAGGVELLYTMYCDVLGLPLPAARRQHYRGTKWLDLRHDLQSAWCYWRRNELTLSQWVQSLRGRKTHAVFSWRDPKPFLADVRNAAGLLRGR